MLSTHLNYYSVHEHLHILCSSILIFYSIDSFLIWINILHRILYFLHFLLIFLLLNLIFIGLSHSLYYYCCFIVLVKVEVSILLFLFLLLKFRHYHFQMEALNQIVILQHSIYLLTLVKQMFLLIFIINIFLHYYYHYNKYLYLSLFSLLYIYYLIEMLFWKP
jgi:hypothetical protein